MIEQDLALDEFDVPVVGPVQRRKRSGRFKEKDLCTEIIRSLQKEGLWALKIPDTPVSYQQQDGNRTRFNLPRQVDIVVCAGGVFVAIEVKLKRNGGAVRKSDIRDVQRAALTAIGAAGGYPYLAVGWRFKAGPKQRERFGAKRVRELYMVPWAAFCRLAGATDGSVTREQLREDGWGVEWHGGALWDMTEIVAYSWGMPRLQRYPECGECISRDSVLSIVKVIEARQGGEGGGSE